MAGVAPEGQFVATAAPENLQSFKDNHVISTKFVKISRKAGVLHINDPLPEPPPLERQHEQPQSPDEDPASKREQQKMKQVRNGPFSDLIIIY